MRKALLILTALALVSAANAPSIATAQEMPRACSLLQPSTVARVLHRERARAEAGVGPQESRGVSRARVVLDTCNYWSGERALAFLVVSKLSSQRAARRELRAIVRMYSSANGQRPRRISGPWHRAYQFRDDHVYARQGRYVVDFQLTRTDGKPRRFPRRAVRRLAGSATRSLRART